MPTPEELEAKRAEAIAKKEAARVERVEEIKAKKAEKAEERRKEEERQAEEKRKADEKKAELEALAKKREEAIAQKEAERKQRANEIKEKKKKKQSSKYSKAEILLLKEVYDQYDSDNSGSVTITEMQAALKDSNLVDSTESMLRELDKDGNGSVDFKELLKVRLRRPPHPRAWHTAANQVPRRCALHYRLARSSSTRTRRPPTST